MAVDRTDPLVRVLTSLGPSNWGILAVVLAQIPGAGEPVLLGACLLSAIALVCLVAFPDGSGASLHSRQQIALNCFGLIAFTSVMWYPWPQPRPIQGYLVLAVFLSTGIAKLAAALAHAGKAARAPDFKKLSDAVLPQPQVAIVKPLRAEPEDGHARQRG